MSVLYTPGAPRGRGGVPPTQCGSHSPELAEKSTLPIIGYAHATWMPYAQRWGKTKTSLGAGRGSCLLLFGVRIATFWNEV